MYTKFTIWFAVAVAIAGYLLVAITLILGGLQFLNLQFELFDTTNVMIFKILPILLIAASAIALWKAYIIDGVTYIIVGLSCSGFVLGTFDPMFMIAIAVAAVATAFMAYRVGDIFVLGLNAAFAASMILMAFLDGANFISDNPGILCIPLLISGIIAGYLCISDWMLVQDISMDFEEEMYGDDKCCCDDDCDGGDNCQCHCHDEECQSEEKQE